MKTVIINGSPHKSGDTATLITYLKESLSGEIKQFDAYDGSIHPCTDCRACWSNDACTINDAFPTLLRAINDADLVVIASPVYFSELTGPLLSVASRLQFVWTGNAIRHRPAIKEKQRRGIILLCGGGQGAPNKALDTAACLLRQLGAQLVGSVCSLQTDNVSAAQDKSIKAQIRDLINQL